VGIWLFVGLWMVAILFTSSVSAPAEGGPGILGFLKAKGGHVFVYAVLGWSLASALTSRAAGIGLGRRAGVALAVAVAALFAALDETRQGFVYGRTALPADVLLDTASATVGALLQRWQCRAAGTPSTPERDLPIAAGDPVGIVKRPSTDTHAAAVTRDDHL
jgi:hypothetical protein